MATLAISLVTVLALGFEPFVQQSLRFPSKETLTTGVTPTLQGAQTIPYLSGDPSDPGLNLKSLLSQALYADKVAPLQPSCPLTRCDWPSYSTLAVCSSCRDVLNQTTVIPYDSATLAAFRTGAFLDDFKDMQDMSNAVFNDYSAQADFVVSLGAGASSRAVVNYTTSISVFATNLIFLKFDYPTQLLFDASEFPLLEETDDRSSLPMPNMTGPLTTLEYITFDFSTNRFQLEATSAQLCSISMCAQRLTTEVLNGTMSTKVIEQTWGSYIRDEPVGTMPVAYSWTA